ncbi:unnamed protein product [Alopecurus aequalis]
MENETRLPAAADAVISQVLDNSDLLNEILLLVGFPTTLVRAALVCKRWLGLVADRAFLRRFRELHPPRLLGFYIEDTALPTYTPPFVPVLPQPPELAAVLRRASINMDVFRYRYTYIHDCRNGSVLRGIGENTYRVHSPLCPAKDLAIPTIPRHELHTGYYSILNQILSKEESDGRLSYFYLRVQSTYGAPKREFRLPPGVNHGRRGTTLLSRAHDASGVYLIHVKEFQLRIWIYKGDNWMLMGGCALHLDIKCRTLSTVYKTKACHLGDINPFMMIWPPIFPALKYKIYPFPKNCSCMTNGYYKYNLGDIKEES